jgi:MFS family permease
MGSVYGTEAGLGIGELSFFIAMIYVGGLVMQYPIGWMSDRMDRRVLIAGVALVGGFAALVASVAGNSFAVLVAVGFLVGGTANPLYGLVLAYTNDMLDYDKMAGASGGLLFINGVGAVAGPLITGWVMNVVGPSGFWVYITILMVGLAAYAFWRMTQRASSVSVEDTVSYAPVAPIATPVAATVAQEYYAETIEETVGENAESET